MTISHENEPTHKNNLVYDKKKKNDSCDKTYFLKIMENLLKILTIQYNNPKLYIYKKTSHYLWH